MYLQKWVVLSKTLLFLLGTVLLSLNSLNNLNIGKCIYQISSYNHLIFIENGQGASATYIFDNVVRSVSSSF